MNININITFRTLTLNLHHSRMNSTDLVIENGFAVLNDFKLDSKNIDDKDESNSTTNTLPRYPFASYSDALTISSDEIRTSFLKDCSLVFTARTKEDSEGYSTGSTFFLPCLMKPRCALEALAYTIFNIHVDSLGKDKYVEQDGEPKLIYDPERSGAEWWTLVLDTPNDTDSRNIKNDDDDDDDKCDEDEQEDDEVGIHFDADYGLEEQLPNYTLHPRVATITYLSDIGVPTLIFNKRSPPPSDCAKSSLNGSIYKAWLSHPSFGKHVAFDGRFLHGAPGEYFPSIKKINVTEPKSKKLKLEDSGQNNNTLGGKRVTFLVNIWLNHCPLDPEPLDDEIVEKLTTPWQDTGKESDSSHHLKEGDPYVEPYQWNLQKIESQDILNRTITLSMPSTDTRRPPAGEEHVVICNRNVTVQFGASMDDFHNASRLAAESCGSIEIDLEEGVIELTVGEEASKSSSDDDDD